MGYCWRSKELKVSCYHLQNFAQPANPTKMQVLFFWNRKGLFIVNVPLEWKARWPIQSWWKSRFTTSNYADDYWNWIVGLFGLKLVALQIKNEISQFLRYRLKLDLSIEKTKITRKSSNTALFFETLVQSASRNRCQMKWVKARGDSWKRGPSGVLHLNASMPRIIARLGERGVCSGEPKAVTK